MFFVSLTVFHLVTKVASGRLATPMNNMDYPYKHDVSNFETLPLVGKYQHRSIISDEIQKLQYSLFNWELCTSAPYNTSYTPMNSLVPNNTVFLVHYPTYQLDNSSATCRAKTITRTTTINTGQQTIFFAIKDIINFDYEDDWETGICSNSTAESQKQRLADGEAQHQIYTNASFLDGLYYDLDGTAVEPIYLYDASEHHLLACEDDHSKTDEEYWKLVDPSDEGDTCDVEPFQVIGGMDAYPILGWYGLDIREWVDGETHTYEFGYLSDCKTAKYILTAKSEGMQSRVCQPTSWWLLLIIMGLFLLPLLL